MRQAIHEAVIDARDIAAITAVSMREGIILFDKHMKVLWTKVKVDNRAIGENAAYTGKEHIEIISRETGRIPTTIRVIGGASRGILWPQIVSDAQGVPLEIPKVADSTYMGAAICVMDATGEFKNWDEAVKRLIQIKRVIQPDLKEKVKYDDLFDQWLKVYEKMLVISAEELLPPMWRAAGALPLEIPFRS